MTTLDVLFTPFDLGGFTARNRIAVAPCSRHRARLDGTPTEMMVEYYRQRASAGVIVAEATGIGPMGMPYQYIPGIWTEAHVRGWRRVTDAVHAEGGSIVLQLLHGGRLTDPLSLPDEATPIAPSAVRPDPKARHYTVNCARAKRPYVTPRALETREVQGIVEEFAAAAVRARDAGFDAVEVHAGSGYLPMQFLTTNTNQRTDRYGGNVAGRARFLLECVEAIQARTSEKYVAVKVSPGWTYHDVFDDDPQSTYTHVARELSARRIAYLQVGSYGQDWDVHGALRPLFAGPYMAVSGYSRIDAAEAIAAGRFDLIAYGQAYMANPDLVERFRQGWGLNVPDREAFYTQGVEGYSDFPRYADADPAALVPVDQLFGRQAQVQPAKR